MINAHRAQDGEPATLRSCYVCHIEQEVTVVSRRGTHRPLLLQNDDVQRLAPDFSR
jgi:hypothetical protein